MKSESGFTLPELIMVVVVISLLCLAAIPQFFSMQNARRQTEMEKVVAVVQAGVQREQAKSIAADNKKEFPPLLDEQPGGKTCQSCFAKILDKPLDDKNWFKASESEYYFSRNGNHDSVLDYQEDGDFRVLYDRQSGTFAAQQIQK